jgi:hypothetical protein
MPLQRKADEAALSLRSKELDLLSRNYKNNEDKDAGVDRLMRRIKEAVVQHIIHQSLLLFPFLCDLVSLPSL